MRGKSRDVRVARPRQGTRPPWASFWPARRRRPSSTAKRAGWPAGRPATPARWRRCLRPGPAAPGACGWPAVPSMSATSTGAASRSQCCTASTGNGRASRERGGAMATVCTPAGLADGRNDDRGRQLDFQNFLIEKQQRRERLILRAGGHVPVDRQMGEERLDLRRPYLPRMPFVVVQNESFDPIDLDDHFVNPPPVSGHMDREVPE